MNLAEITTFKEEDEGVLSGQVLLSVFAQEPVIRAMEFSPDTSNYIQEANDAEDDGTSITRSEGDPLKRQTVTGEPTLGELALYGKEYSIDDVKQYDENVGAAPSVIKRRAAKKMKKLMKDFRERYASHVIQGGGNAGDNEEMYGLGEIVKDAADSTGQDEFGGYSASDIHSMLTQVEIDLTSKQKIFQFLEVLERELELVPGANALICNKYLKGRLTTGAREMGVLDETQDSWGKSIDTIFDTPIFKTRKSAIPNTDDWTNHELATSLYIARMEEDTGLDYPTNSGFAYYGFDDPDTPQGVSRVQIFNNTRLNDVDCVRRLSRIGLQQYTG